MKILSFRLRKCRESIRAPDLLVVPAGNLEDVSLEFIAEGVGRNLWNRPNTAKLSQRPDRKHTETNSC